MLARRASSGTGPKPHACTKALMEYLLLEQTNMSERVRPAAPSRACSIGFLRHELDDSMGGKVPDGMAEEISGNTARMRGTDYDAHQIWLTGKVDKRSGCGICRWRPSLLKFAEAATPAFRADARHGLPALTTS